MNTQDERDFEPAPIALDLTEKDKLHLLALLNLTCRRTILKAPEIFAQANILRCKILMTMPRLDQNPLDAANLIADEIEAKERRL